MLRRLVLVAALPLLAAAAPLPVRVQTVVFAPRGEDPADLRFSQVAAKAALRAAQADAGNARIDLARYSELGRGSPAYLPSEYDRRLAAARGAEARMAQAQRVTALPVQVGQVVASGQTVATVAHTDAIEIVADVPENRLAEIHAADAVGIRLRALPTLYCVAGCARSAPWRTRPAARSGSRSACSTGRPGWSPSA